MFTHFLEAQNLVYPQVLTELRAGQKRTHWMWFIFPQIAGLGRSDMAQRFAIKDLEEARLYLADPVLGTRLRECTRAVLLHAPDSVAPRSLDHIFGSPDNMKFHSSMTLFARAAPQDPLVREALTAFFGGREDPGTVSRLEDAGASHPPA
ncbi:DUF1810 domain-containing protein [Devosia sp. 1566]|uniref:DUF1810 domain-containing protein n=1 Tax=Devosia sp. 1566 TaxID=2499144 RepID=UPI000FDAB66C|nr:DUF1810 domain-containing protein [Devosia sp. 1566]